MKCIKLSLLLYFIAYILVTDIGIIHTIFNIKVLKMKSMKESEGMDEGYEKTKPYHPLYNLIIFPIFSYLYLHSINNLVFNDVIINSIVWGIITIILDLVFWVLIKHPWSLSFKEFYKNYQPWLTIIYIIIFLSPFIGYLFIG